jgi:PAS domain S-box-containing protein
MVRRFLENPSGHAGRDRRPSPCHVFDKNWLEDRRRRQATPRFFDLASPGIAFALLPPMTLVNRLWSFIPSGGSLPEGVWRARHRFLVGLTFFHVVIIALAGPVLGKHWELSVRSILDDDSMLHVIGEALVVALFGTLACWRAAGRTMRATFVGFGLMSSSAILVHLSGGYIEFHFHFFVMLTFLALSQDWIPYLLAVAYVAVHHGVVGVLWPQSVYNHEAAFNAPWTWAGIHALFVLWSCVGSVIAWRFNERAFAQTALILQATGEGIFGVDTEAQVTFINPAAATILGVDARAIIGKKLGQIVHHLATDGTRLPDAKSPILAPLKGAKAHRATDQIFGRMDGSYVPVDYVSTPMIERDQLTGVVVSFNDITARHRSEAALQQSHRMLEETLQQLKTTQQQMLQQERLRAMGQMASGIAHDFNNSLSPIVGFAELLMRTPDLPRETTQTYAELINTAALDAASVIRRLRELYRDRSEGVIGDPVDLRRCVDEVVALTQPRWKNQALGQGIAIRIDTRVDDVPRFSGDAAGIREMLANLIFNAVDAMPKGGTITVRARSDGAWARLEVSDTGIGMSDEVRQHCLEPFFTTKGQHGTGLGLSLVHTTVQRHDGTLTIESEPGRGSTFIVRFPVHDEPAPAVASVESPASVRPLHILVVDDDPVVRKSVVAQLNTQAHTVETASNGREGLDRFEAGRFDLVVTDRAMPEMGGDQLAATIQRSAPDTPVIMLTGFGDLMSARGEHPVGVDAVVSKPVTLAALTQAILKVIAHR